ncbi:hypothetical protein C5167_023163 [Papaver somniferum]|uniref:Major facilitator superfamily (MFS) profile domain-containing protein n=1 Tax=Papaver somniferum TaxID=3469 RepID=A0A4Y7JN76_PAPSO|nr:hypothetical protein C5167_023163 [Papaver somniferum]
MEDSTKYPLLTDNNILVDDEDDDQGVGLKISIDHHKPVQVIKGGWKSAIYIIGVEVAERFAFAGTSGNLITYLTDVLGQSTAEAAQKVNVWSGVATLLPILGAIIADSYLGRFDTILISSIIYIMGLVMLTLSVSTLIPLKFHYWVFFFSLHLVAIGEGGHKPCVQTFGAEQFDESIPEERKAKSSFFNWWYFGICSGSLVGSRFYRSHVPKGSPFVRIIQVFVAAYRKRHRCVSKDGVPLYEEENRDDAGSASKGRILTPTMMSDTKNDWSLCSVTQVEEVKLLIRLVPVWLSCLSFAVVDAQEDTPSSTFLLEQQ